MKRLLLAAVAAIAPLGAQTYVIQNATVMTVSKGTIKNGSIVVKDGKIAEVGEKVTIPPGAWPSFTLPTLNSSRSIPVTSYPI